MIRRLRARFAAVVDRGASAVEYGLMIAAISAVIVGIVFGFGTIVKNTFNQTANCISNQVSPSQC